ncbi:hypothetical protein SERLA73DRAFT_68583 [Serpula lacrymans var. lacrymans S7.3]|uniref:GAG-pre-integrase domain-containing protein n=1 Tax=Serpula lacrymans var. lacrymans (strain S7.3) TaxID=936435 RepID=F8PH28_SERL3|nr:hypothetical protein SERLA73DRAFT_68583 [Serpula lacrymans var. lacrymans S7.3]
MAQTLISASCMDSAGYAIHIENGACMIKTPLPQWKVIAIIPQSEGLYQLSKTDICGMHQANVANQRLNVNELHRKIGHIEHKAAKHLKKSGMAKGVEIDPSAAVKFSSEEHKDNATVFLAQVPAQDKLAVLEPAPNPPNKPHPVKQGPIHPILEAQERPYCGQVKPPGFYQNLHKNGRTNLAWMSDTEESEAATHQYAMAAADTAAKSSKNDSPSITEALNGCYRMEWLAAIEEEIKQIDKLHTWDLVEPPANANIICLHYVTQIK